MCYVGLNRLEDAIVTAAFALKLQPDAEWIHPILGQAQAAICDYPVAAKSFEAYLKAVDPGSAKAVQVRMKLIENLLRCQPPARALEELTRVRPYVDKYPGMEASYNRAKNTVDKMLQLEASSDDYSSGQKKANRWVFRQMIVFLCLARGDYLSGMRILAKTKESTVPSSQRRVFDCLLASTAVQAATISRLSAAKASELRNKGLSRLLGVLEEYEHLLETNKAGVHQLLEQWRLDPRLDSIRNKARLATLPDSERKNWAAFWVRVNAAWEASH